MDALRIIEERWPEIATRITRANAPEGAVVEAGQGRCRLSIGGRSLCSAVNPRREAERVLAREFEGGFPRRLALLGHGLGHYVDLLLETEIERLDLHIPDPGLFALALEHWRHSEALADPRLNLVDPAQSRFPRSGEAGVERALEVPAFRRTHPEFLARRRVALDQLRSAAYRLRVLVVEPVYGGSLPVARSAAAALRGLGHVVKTVSYEGMEQAHQRLIEFGDAHRGDTTFLGDFGRLLARMLHAEAAEFRPDLVLALAQSPATPEVSEAMRLAGSRTAFWFVEDHERLTYWKGLHGHFDLFLTIQRGAFLKQLAGLSSAPARYLPLCADAESCYEERDPEERHGLSFVGAGFYNRERFFLELMDLGLKIWGAEWNPRHPIHELVQEGGRRTDPDRNRRIFSNSRINLNLHSSTYHAGIVPGGDFLNPRTFEIPACGGFELVDRRELLAPEFEEGAHLDTFGSIEELRDKILYYRERPEETRRIAECGRDEVAARHTYRHRMAELLELALLIDEDFFPHAMRIEDQRLGEVRDPRLKAFLGALPETVEPEIDRIAEYVSGREEALDETGALMLYMAEIRRWARDKRVDRITERSARG